MRKIKFTMRNQAMKLTEILYVNYYVEKQVTVNKNSNVERSKCIYSTILTISIDTIHTR